MQKHFPGDDCPLNGIPDASIKSSTDQINLLQFPHP